VTEEHPWILVTFCVEVPEGAQQASHSPLSPPPPLLPLYFYLFVSIQVFVLSAA
jgi:hypothetical protein